MTMKKYKLQCPPHSMHFLNFFKEMLRMSRQPHKWLTSWFLLITFLIQFFFQGYKLTIRTEGWCLLNLQSSLFWILVNLRNSSCWCPHVKQFPQWPTGSYLLQNAYIFFHGIEKQRGRNRSSNKPPIQNTFIFNIPLCWLKSSLCLTHLHILVRLYVRSNVEKNKKPEYKGCIFNYFWTFFLP